MSLTGNFDKLNKGNGGQETVPPDLSMDETENYVTPSQTRNLCFVQPDGKRLFLNYAYLVSGEYVPETNTIKLVYTTHEITIKGNNLNNLFDDLMHHLIKFIVCQDRRYLSITESNDYVITVLEVIYLK